MAEFANPFSGNVDRKMSNSELAQAIRLDIAAELEAIYLYAAHAEATTDPLAKKVLEDIRDEEIVHVGEFITLMNYLDPTHQELMDNGGDEVREMMDSLGIKPVPISQLDDKMSNKEKKKKKSKSK